MLSTHERALNVSDLRVLHVVTDRDRRGAQVFGSDLAVGLGLLGVDNEVVALAPGRHDDGLPVDCLGPSRRSPKTFRALRQRARSFDVVIAHGSSTLLVSAAALVGTRTPIVYRQISDPLHWAASWSRRVRVALYLRRAAAIVALSETVASTFRRYYRLGSKRIEVIPNAVPSQKFELPSPSRIGEARRRFGLREDQPVAVYVGALAAEKGVDIAIGSAGRIDSLQLLVVGDGPERARLETMASEIAPERVSFTGAITDPAEALVAADVLLLPSRAGDSMPAVLIEAGLTGLPSVTTPVGSITDVVVDEETGLVVPIGEEDAFTGAVRKLFDDPDLRRAYGAAARVRCEERFTIERTALEWCALLTDVTSR